VPKLSCVDVPTAEDEIGMPKLTGPRWLVEVVTAPSATTLAHQ
jgi:hypothetical protein